MKTVTNEMSNTRQIDLKVGENPGNEVASSCTKRKQKKVNAMNNVSIPLVPAAHLDKVTF